MSEQKCNSCNTKQQLTGFYNTNNTLLFPNGKVTICKKCIKKTIDYNNMETIYNVLKQMGTPFIYEYWEKAMESKSDTFGNYMRMANSLPQFKGLTWEDSIFQRDDKQEVISIDKEKINISKRNFEVTDEIIDKWGAGYSPEEYQNFEKKYMLLKNNYSEKTAMHTEALFNYIRYRVKEEMATASGNVKDAKEWGALAKDAANAAKINPNQLTKADLSDGLSTFSELSQAVEREVDIIPILPQFKYRPNDALDFNIWCYVNYMRDLAGLPLCKYEEIYEFYDKRKEEYVEQYGDPYGIFTNDPTEKNRENIIKFIDEDRDDNL